MKSGMKTALRIVALFSVVAAVGCSTEQKKPEGNEGAEKRTEEGAAGGVKPTGDTIKIELYSDEKGNYFKPSELEAHQGDVLRFQLKSGVHNVHFLPDSNPGKVNLPPATDMLQLPGQTLDLPVNLAPGKYYFQCDPHAATGMMAHVEVEH